MFFFVGTGSLYFKKPTPVGGLCIGCCAELVVYGVGYHHAGMEIADRKVMEGMFTTGDLPVLCQLLLNPMACFVAVCLVDNSFTLLLPYPLHAVSTSTLAMGVRTLVLQLSLRVLN